MSDKKKEKNKRWEAITEGINYLNLGVTIFGDDLKLVFANKKFLEMLDFPLSFAEPGTSLETFLHYNVERGEYGEGDPKKQITFRMDRAWKFIPHKLERTRPDGTIIEIVGTPIPGKGFITTYTDVTKLRHSAKALHSAYQNMERNVAERTEEAEEKSRLLETTMENISQAISFFDKDLKLAAANPQFFEILGFPQSLNKVGTPLEEFFRWNAKRGEYGKGDIETQVNERLELARQREAHRFRRPRPDGSVIEVDGKPLAEGGFITTYTDVTEEAKAIAALEVAKKEAESANRSKSEFLANMSHELRTPLNAIIGFSEAISLEIFGSIANQKYKEYANNIHNSGNHLLQLINEILDVSIIEAGKLVLECENATLDRISDGAIRIVQTRADDQGVILTNRSEGDQTLIYVDVRRTRQILINLLSNAIKFTPKGGLIELGPVKRENGAVGFFVKDTGIGMTKEGIEKALTPFGQVESSLMKSHDGLGLGLPLTNELIKAHGGYLDIDSTPNGGTTIKAIFPPARTK